VVVSFDWDDAAENAAGPGAPGTEHSSPQGHRGMHGSFSPIDVHNVLIGMGPSFRPGFVNEYPSSNLDVAPTVATLLGLEIPHAEGRTLEEAFVSKDASYTVAPFEEQVGPVPLAKACRLDDPDCKRPIRGLEYSYTLYGQTLTTSEGARQFVYFDRAKVSRVRPEPED